jgi:hypothetical protein
MKGARIRGSNIMTRCLHCHRECRYRDAIQTKHGPMCTRCALKRCVQHVIAEVQKS